MRLTGSIKIHKSDGITRPARQVEILDNGCLAVWDDDKTKEPDIVVQDDKWERVEREDSSWRHTSPQAIMKEAEERDDVDEDKVAKFL